MHIVLADIDEVAMRSVEAELAEAGTQVLTVVCNTSSEAEVQALAAASVERFGGAHVLCNNAGVVGRGDAWRGPMAGWDWVIGINLYGVIHGIRAFLPIMEDQGEGHIVNTASMAGLVVVPGAAPYNVTKTGVVALSEGLFIELKATGSPVRVSALCPGFVRTNLLEGQQWDARLGSDPGAPVTPMGQMMDQVLRQGVEDGITDLITDFVGMPLGDRFRGEDVATHGGGHRRAEDYLATSRLQSLRCPWLPDSTGAGCQPPV